MDAVIYNSTTQNMTKRNEKNLIKISRQEADIIREQLPKINVVVVNRTKPYKKYWVEEDRSVLLLLQRLRGVRLLPQRPKNKGWN